MKKLICKSGLRKNGTAWYMVDGKFVNKATFMDAYYATDREEVEADISPALLLVMGVVVLVFVTVLLGIMVGDAKISKCGTYQYWGGNGVIWFVEDTCRGIR